jgi:1-acyl-sn-glycerol-3-phosphate acyltransferase
MANRNRGIQYYTSFSEDFVDSGNQSYSLPDDFSWSRTDLPFRIGSAVAYGIGVVCAELFDRLYLHAHFVDCRGARRPDDAKRGFVLYANHTQAVGDPLTPAVAIWPVRPYVLAGPANLAVPVIGRILPQLGALIIPSTLKGMKEFRAAVDRHLAADDCVVVYPEAHVWPWCTTIRPFDTTSFAFPIDSGVPAYCMTTTYQPRPHHARPKATIYLDGPFYPDAELPRREQRQQLHDVVFERMTMRSRESTANYITYVPLKDACHGIVAKEATCA